MKRYSALLKDTWWLWLTVVPAGCVAGFTVSVIFFVTIPVCLFTFLYFGIMRYDDDGNHKEGLDH